jgi:CMP-N-acetylneuraminic acid synthetase
LVKEFSELIQDKHQERTIVMLYLTYPERTFEEVSKALEFYHKNNLKSLLCKKEVKSHPYLCMFEEDDGRGRQIVEHNLYRRQDYPKCFEISHYISIFDINEIANLNNNLYNKDTYFYQICDKIDVDEEKDLRKYNEQN